MFKEDDLQHLHNILDRLILNYNSSKPGKILDAYDFDILIEELEYLKNRYSNFLAGKYTAINKHEFIKRLNNLYTEFKNRLEDIQNDE